MKPLQVLNVKFVRKNNVLDQLAINRGVYCVWMGVTKGGGLLVKLKGFDRYYFDPETYEVVSRHGPRDYRPVKCYNDGGVPYHRLYRHGVVEKITRAQILRENMKGIETWFESEDPANRKRKTELALASA